MNLQALNLQVLAVSFLATVAVGGVAWVFLYPILSGQRQAEKRRDSVARAEPAVRVSRGAQKSRRDQVEESLRELEKRQARQQRLPLSARISQAGLSWSKRQFFLIAAAMGVFAFLATLGGGLGLMAAFGFGFTAAFGMPFWLLSWLKTRRENKFLNALPDAVDVIVRGIKSGLPLLDSMKVIAAEAQEPVRSEFRNIIETQTIGMPLGEACQKLHERMPLPEANFFGIVIAIQQKSGGNLSEALGNLSKVLRDRKKMKAKIQAMSMEAKASAAIIGSLPPMVMLIVYLTSPNYMTILWTHPMGQMMLAASGIWMLLGCLVMRKMINFDF
jgi:tight adherence protein B